MSSSHLASVERGLQRGYAAMVVLFSLAWVFALPVGPGPVTGLLVVWAVQTHRAWHTRLGPPDVLVMGATTVAVYAAMSPDLIASLPAGARVQPAVTVVALAAGLLGRGIAAPVVAGAAAAYVIAFAPHDGLGSALDGLWPLLATTVAAGVTPALLRRAATNADRAHDATTRARLGEAHAEGRRAAHREFQRTLHDDVNAALRAVAVGVRADLVRQSCAAALLALTRTAPQEPDAFVDLSEALAGVGRTVRTPVDVTAETGVVVPGAVASAVLAATGEALRNVDFHARATLAVVRLRRRADGVEVTVRDDGIGLGATRPDAVGLTRSVVDRMADVGGHATIGPAPGRGVVVTLIWAPPRITPPSDRSDHLLALAVGEVRAPLATVCAPFVVGILATAIIHAGDGPAMGWLVAWYVPVIGATAALIAVADRGPSRLVTLTTGFATVGWVAVALLFVPADALSGYASWPIGAVTPLLTVLAIVRPLWESLVAWAAEVLLVCGYVLAGPLELRTFADLLPAVCAPLYGLLMGGMIALTIRRLGRVIERERAERLAIVVGHAGRAARAALRRRRAADIGARLTPFLTSVVTGAAAVEDTVVRGTARRLEQLARDELHLPGVLDDRTRELLAESRERGCAVTLIADPDAIDVPPSVTRALHAVLVHCRTPEELTLSVYHHDTGLQVSVVVAPGDPGHRDGLATVLREWTPTIVGTEDASWVELRMPAAGVPDFEDYSR